MRPFASLSTRGQLARLRRLARTALASYPGDLQRARLTPLRYEQNATFRVDGDDARHVLRISRPDLHTEATVRSETAWLAALRMDADAPVPEPVPTREGEHVVVASVAGVPERRLIVLLRWLDGRFVDRGLTPEHLRQVGALLAALQIHAEAWARPSWFIRPRVDTITAEAKRASLTGGTGAAPGPIPSIADGDRALALVAELLPAGQVPVVERALETARRTTAELGSRPRAYGLIHADLHQENFFFHAGAARAIDFDDCGWGFFLYDLAVPLSELTARPKFVEIRDALLDGFGRRRPLPDGAEKHVDAFIVLRGLQLLTWILESREHAAFRDRWRSWAEQELQWLARRCDAF